LFDGAKDKDGYGNPGLFSKIETMQQDQYDTRRNAQLLQSIRNQLITLHVQEPGQLQKLQIHLSGATAMNGVDDVVFDHRYGSKPILEPPHWEKLVVNDFFPAPIVGILFPEAPSK